MKRILLIFTLLLNSFIFAQKSNYDFVKAERDTRKLVYSNPDSALIVIKKTLSQRSQMHDTIYGNTYNLYGTYYRMKGERDSTIYFYNKSIGYLDNYPVIKTRSLANIAIAYRNMADYKTSIKYLNESIKINTNQNNKIGVAIAYSEMASNYNLMNEYKTSVAYLLKAIELVKNDKSSNRYMPSIKQKLANTYLAMHNYKFAIDLYREVLISFKERGQLKNYYLTLVNLGDALTHIEDYTEAKKSLEEAISGLEQFADKEMIGICYGKIGDLNYYQGNNEKAAIAYQNAINNLAVIPSGRIIRIAGDYIVMLNDQKNFTKSLEIINSVNNLNVFSLANLEDQSVFKQAEAHAYDGSHNDKEAIEAFKKTISIMDSVYSQKRNYAVDEVQAKYQTEIQRDKNLLLVANNTVLQKDIEVASTRNVLYGVASMAAILIVIVGYRQKNKLQKEKVKTLQAENIVLEQQHLHEQEITNSQREIIEEKQREFTSSALRMANQQDTINDIITICDSASANKVADIKQGLMALVRQQDYWKQFEIRFNKLHPDFNSSLTANFSKLTKNDLEFCSLLKLKLSNKEIASLLQISHESVISKKYRIKKKMEITGDDEFEKLLTEL